MIEIEIPKDMNKYEAKLFGPFTTRQTICFVLACICGIPTFLFLRDKVVTDVASIITMLVFIPFILVGWIKPYGMNFEDFARTAFISNFLAPAKRKYVTINQFELLMNPDFTYEDAKKIMNVSEAAKKERRKEANKVLQTDIKYYK